MFDDIRRLSDELARDPGSRVFVPLGEALRQQGQHDMALKVTLRGLERHPHLADAHDLLARISADRGDMERAFDEWDMVLRLSPGHPGALKGMGFICFQRRLWADAERYLTAAASAGGADAQVTTALEKLRASRAGDTPAEATAAAPEVVEPVAREPEPVKSAPPATDPISSDSRWLFVDVLPDEGQTALLLDPAGLVLAGAYIDGDGRDVGEEVGAELSGVTDAARRATRHLQMGDWTQIVFETEVAVVAMAPSTHDGLLVLATSRATPLGLVRRLLDRCRQRAVEWLGAAG